MKFRCPTCKKEVDNPNNDPEGAQYFPFCSERCQLIDLGCWFDADYVISSEISAENRNDTT